MSRNPSDVVIAGGCRTPIGRFGGSLKEVRAHQLAALVMNEAVRRAGVDKAGFDEIIVGDCIQCPDEANTARTAALVAGFPVEVSAYTIQKQCSSSMQALSCARQMIMAGDASMVLVAGAESMSNAPYVLPTARWGQRLMDGRMVDSVWELLHSGGDFLPERLIMGETAERLADLNKITREEQDEVALRSHKNAQAATEAGRFSEEIVPVPVGSGKKAFHFSADEHTRLNLTMEELVRLKPTFRKEGTVTAGNSSGLNDGAAAAIVLSRAKAEELGVKPLGRIVAQTSAGVDPAIMGYGPVPATKKLLERTGRTVADIGLFEYNEAFAAQYLACEKGLGLPRERVNVNGSGIGLGHPVGCTGLRIVLSLLYEMRRRGEALGIASLCVGGGMGMATMVELEG